MNQNTNIIVDPNTGIETTFEGTILPVETPEIDELTKAKQEAENKVNKIVSGLNGKATLKDHGAKKIGEVHAVPLSEINVVEGFNRRNPNSPTTLKHIAELEKSIRSQGQLTPLRGYMENGLIFVIDGHCRYRALLIAATKNQNIKTARIEIVKKTKPEDRTAEMLVSNIHQALSPLEKGLGYKELQKFDWSNGEIAETMGCKPSEVSNLLFLAEMPNWCHELIESEKISSTLMIELARAFKEDKEIDWNAFKALIDTGLAEAGDRKLTKKFFKVKIVETPADTTEGTQIPKIPPTPVSTPAIPALPSNIQTAPSGQTQLNGQKPAATTTPTGTKPIDSPIVPRTTDGQLLAMAKTIADSLQKSWANVSDANRDRKVMVEVAESLVKSLTERIATK